MDSRTAAFLLISLLGACAPEQVAEWPNPPADWIPPAGAQSEDGQEASVAWEEAGAEFDVPPDLLMAVALAQTGMQMVVGIEGHDERPAAYGLMALRGQQVVDAAGLLGVEPDDVRYDRVTHIRGAAALLSERADELSIDREDLAAWAPAVAWLSGIVDPEAQSEFVWRYVYKRLRYGDHFEGRAIKAFGVDPDFPAPVERRGAAGPDYGGSIWRPSPNFDSRSAGAGGIGMVIIHTCEGGYSGCWSWLTNPSSGVSAHYVVNETGSEVSQLVSEDKRAWHVGATYDCALNGGTDCWRDGWNVNHFTVGIEHGGYASQSSWSDGLLHTSSALTCDITRDHGIPRDSYHIVAHGRLQPWSRTDPGPNWPWTDYINRVQVHCGDVPGGGPGPTPPGQFVVDSNNSYNDTAVYYSAVSGNWWSSQSVAGYWGSGYLVTSTAATSDPAHFYFYEDSDTCYDVHAWWTSAYDRSRAAPFIGYNGAGAEVGRTYADQQGGHARWNALGTWAFSAGWNDVALSRWAASGYYVIGDAVRLTPSSACTGCQFQDGDGDGTTDCTDSCPADPGKASPGVCGCGVADTDADGDGARDCQDACPVDPGKSAPGTCGCGVADVDTDGDSALDCQDACPADAGKVSPAVCGCGVPEEDVTGDGVPDCTDCGDGVLVAPEGCDDGGSLSGDGCSASCQPEAFMMAAPSPGVAGQVNDFVTTGATPGGQVRFYGGTHGGSTRVTGCPGLLLPIGSALTLGTVVADGAGRAQLSKAIPAGGAGLTFRLTAVDFARCRTSGLTIETF